MHIYSRAAANGKRVQVSEYSNGEDVAFILPNLVKLKITLFNGLIGFIFV